MGPPRTSLWLVPAPPVRDALQQRIDGLAAALGTPTFGPHVTLVSGVVDDEHIAAALADVAARREPLEVTAGSTAHGPERFKAVYVLLDDDRIRDLAGELAAALRMPFDPADLAPHLSLVYADDLAPAERAEIARQHSVAGERWRFDTVAASRPGG